MAMDGKADDDRHSGEYQSCNPSRPPKGGNFVNVKATYPALS